MTMIHHAHLLSSTPIVSSEECNKLYSIFLKLDYPVNSAICKFLHDIENIRAPKDINDDSPAYHGPGTI